MARNMTRARAMAEEARAQERSFAIIDAKADRLTLAIGRHEFLVDSIEDASRKFCAARDAWGRGASETPTPILRRNGEAFGYVSYNGKVWSGSPKNWKPGAEPLFDPYKMEG